MKLVTFVSPASNGEAGSVPAYLGAWLTGGAGQPNAESRVIDLQMAHVAIQGEVYRPFASMAAWLNAGAEAVDRAAMIIEAAAGERSPVVWPAEQVQLLAPLPRPASIRDCMAFERHLLQCTRAALRQRGRWLPRLDALCRRVLRRPLVPVPAVWYQQPVYYKGNPASVVGPDAEIRWPSYTDRFDFELEFGIVIGRGGRDIARQHAQQHIAGYTIFNDFSARDAQMAEMAARLGPAKGKDFDTGNALGPWLVTPDEIPDPYALRMRARVNGDTWTDGNSREMHFTFEEMIAHISRDETLYPGDFIGSGTVPGGCGWELDRWLQAGDSIELEVDGLGMLRNRIGRKVSAG